MPNLLSVGVTLGIPTSGTGTVSTIDALMALLPTALAANGGLKIEGVASGVAVPVSVASIPSHAVTNAGIFPVQAALDATRNTNLSNIDSATSRLTSSATNIAAGSALATTSFMVGSRYLSTPPTFTNGQEGALQIDSAGRLIVNVGAGGAGGGVVTQATGTNLHTVVDSGAITATLAAETTKVIGTVNLSAAQTLATVTTLTNLNTIFGSTALDLSPGTGGSRTLRVAFDSTQLGSLGQAVPASSVPTVQAGFPYETVAASAAAQVLGGSGAAGDYLSHVTVSPATAGCGIVEIFDNATSLIKFFGGGTTPLPSLIPFVIPVGMNSASGAWKITTGANVSCVAVGRFT